MQLIFSQRVTLTNKMKHTVYCSGPFRNPAVFIIEVFIFLSLVLFHRKMSPIGDALKSLYCSKASSVINHACLPLNKFVSVNGKLHCQNVGTLPTCSRRNFRRLPIM